MEKNYTLILANGTKIENLGLNGNNFVSNSEIDLAVFEGNLDTLTIYKDDKIVQIMNNVEVIQQAHYDDGWYICFRELSYRELNEIRFNAKLEYIAMMTDVELPVEE